jgi:septal ring factor EnvC (AmiA/AmiB activator)
MLSRARIAVALAIASVLALTSHAAGAEDRGGRPSQASDRSGGIGGVWRAARPDAATLAIALAEADRAVADARGKLREARERLALTREYKAQATEALIEVRSRTDELQQTLDARVRDAYMTGNLTGLALLLEADSLPHLLSRTATAGFAAQRERETLVRLQAARDQIASLHATQVQNEREQRAAEAAVAGRLAELLRVRAARAAAKRALDARAAGLAGASAQARAGSQELRRLILQQERTLALAGGGRPVGGGASGRCDLSGVSPAELWIIMRESGGDPAADNPTSTAFGLGQLLLGNRILYLGRDYATTDCGRQLWAFRAYVRDRYGTAERAKAFWQANGWY